MITPYLYLFLSGTGVTLAAWLFASILSVVVGTVLGLVSCRYFERRLARRIINIYTFIAKGVPAYVYVLIAYFVVPLIVGVKLSAFVAASLALAFSSSGYVAEIVRAGIDAVPRGQWAACFVLGYPLDATLSRVIMPQALRIFLPALLGELEKLLKSTSLLATIGVAELTRTGMNIISRELNPLPVYMLIAGIYLLFSGCLYLFKLWLERRIAYGAY
jgi:His/Glu/Gln/Arg/opine family amino acid ABC transporter permease subunit